MDPAVQPRVALNVALLREPYSGVEVMLHETACALSQYGSLSYCIYTPRRQTRPIPMRNDVRVQAVAANASRLQRILWEQCALPQRLLRQAVQVLHAPAYVAPLVPHCPVVLTVHDLHVFTHPQFCSVANRLYFRLLMPLSIRRAAAITVYSEHVRRALVSRFPAAAGKTHLIPPGLPVQFLHPVPDAAREAVRMRLRLPARFLLFVGDLVPRKNLTGLLTAFHWLQSQDPNLHLAIAGAPCGQFQRQNKNPRVQELGYVPPGDLPALYAMAENLLFPSFDEGFGLPALEAMACGCPVVCSPGGAAEVCGDAAIVCDPSSPASIAAAAQTLRRDPALRCAQVAAGLRRAAQFRWERAVQDLEALYRQVQSKRI